MSSEGGAPVIAGDAIAVIALPCMSETKSGILITGVPGFIGGRLAERLLPSGRPLFLLCERRFLADANRFAKTLDPTGEQVSVVGGDITEHDLGLSSEDVARLRAEVSDVYHLAAIYELGVGEALARRVNVLGTAKVVAFLRGFAAGSVRHHYISTCYVAGDREGMIFEDELDRGQGFKNHYEATKYEAEVTVERSKRDIETRIFRPGIVIGDSRTGETAKFDGPYPVFGAVMMGLMVALPGPGRATINLVPVDFVIECLVRIPEQPGTASKTFQLADPAPLASRAVVELVAARTGSPRPRLVLPPGLVRRALKLPRVAELAGIGVESLAYFNHPQTYDTTNTRAALAGTGCACPPLPTYINQILRHYRQRAKLAWRFDDGG